MTIKFNPMLWNLKYVVKIVKNYIYIYIYSMMFHTDYGVLSFCICLQSVKEFQFSKVWTCTCVCVCMLIFGEKKSISSEWIERPYTSLICGSNPISSILSASSKTTNETLEREVFPCCKWSINLPGVATTISTPAFSSDLCHNIQG